MHILVIILFVFIRTLLGAHGEGHLRAAAAGITLIRLAVVLRGGERFRPRSQGVRVIPQPRLHVQQKPLVVGAKREGRGGLRGEVLAGAREPRDGLPALLVRHELVPAAAHHLHEHLVEVQFGAGERGRPRKSLHPRRGHAPVVKLLARGVHALGPAEPLGDLGAGVNLELVLRASLVVVVVVKIHGLRVEVLAGLVSLGGGLDFPRADPHGLLAVGVRVEDDHGVLPRVIPAADAVHAAEPELLAVVAHDDARLAGDEIAGLDVGRVDDRRGVRGCVGCTVRGGERRGRRGVDVHGSGSIRGRRSFKNSRNNGRRRKNNRNNRNRARSVGVNRPVVKLHDDPRVLGPSAPRGPAVPLPVDDVIGDLAPREHRRADQPRAVAVRRRGIVFLPPPASPGHRLHGRVQELQQHPAARRGTRVVRAGGRGDPAAVGHRAHDRAFHRSKLLERDPTFGNRPQVQVSLPRELHTLAHQRDDGAGLARGDPRVRRGRGRG